MVTRARQESYKSKLLSEGWTRHDIYLPPGIADRLKELQERHRDTSLGAVIARLVLEPKDSDKAVELWEEAGQDYVKARGLLLDYMRQRIPGFNTKKGPGRKEYDSIRKTLHDLSRK